VDGTVTVDFISGKTGKICEILHRKLTLALGTSQKTTLSHGQVVIPQ
jgi:hypothetical protein